MNRTGSATSFFLLSALALACAPGGESAVPGGESAGPAWFRDGTRDAGIDFRHESGASGKLYLPEIMGGGVAIFDADGDGDFDLYMVNQNRLLPEGSVERELPNALWLQREDGSFEEKTAGSGLGDGGFGMGVAIGDVDNDSDADVYVTNFGPDRLYLNRGDGTFEDGTRAAGIDVDGWSTSATFLDYDGDGFLDLYVARYLTWDAAKQCTSTSGRPGYCGPSAFPPARDVLLRNRGDGTFEDRSAASGIVTAAAAGLGVVAEDFDDDGRPDLYVANDGFANNLWLNRGDGTFVDDAVLLGAAYNMRGVAEAGMGVVAADLDNDGLSDLFMTHLDQETNTLYRNLGGGRGFSDLTEAVGLGTGSWRRTGFGTVAFDAELDGDLDLFVANGRVTTAERALEGCEMPPPWDLLAEPNLLYTNDGGGRFESSERGGALVDLIEVSRGTAMGDVDADGDLDLLVGNIHGPARLLVNDAPRSGRPLAIRAVDPALGRDAIGARVTVETDRGRQVRRIDRGGSYLSSSPPVAHFGIPEGSMLRGIEVRWPDGSTERFRPGDGDAMLLVRGEGSP